MSLSADGSKKMDLVLVGVRLTMLKRLKLRR